MPVLPTSPLTPSGWTTAPRQLSPASQLALRVLREPPLTRNERVSKVDASSEVGRLSVASWLFELAEEYADHPQTPHLALAYFDGFFAKGAGLARLAHRTQQLQLAAAACFLLATKMAETNVPDVADFSLLTDGACTRDEILETEVVICNALNFSLCLPTSVDAVPHLCELAAGVVAMDGKELPRMRSFGRGLERATSFQDVADLAANEALADEGMKQPMEILVESQSAMLKKDLAARLHKSAMAFADVASHSQGLAEQQSVGDVAAACLLLARCHVEGADCLGDEWLPIFDRAHLSYAHVVSVAVVILHTWQKLRLLSRNFSPKSIPRQCTSDDVGSPVSSTLPDIDLSFSTDAQHEFALKLQTILGLMPSSCAEMVIAAGVQVYDLSLTSSDRKLPHCKTSDRRNAYVIINHASILLGKEIHPCALLDIVHSLLLFRGFTSAATSTSNATVSTVTAGNRFMKKPLACVAENFSVTPSRRAGSDSKRALRTRKSICKRAHSQGDKENCIAPRSVEILHHSRAVVPSVRAVLPSASAPALERILARTGSKTFADGAISAKLYR